MCMSSLFGELSQEARAQGFVYLHEVDPTIIVSLAYATPYNFLGRVVTGYKRPVAIMTQQAAHALKRVQQDVQKDGYSLVVYDAYRPQQAVDDFVQWGKNLGDQSEKSFYYPRINKAQVFEQGYVAFKSGHSRGSTVDVTLIKKGTVPHASRVHRRTLRDGYTLNFLDDGTVDMGSSFDLFDRASHTENSLIPEKYFVSRRYLSNVMARHGFKNLPDEWWHFTLIDEPFPADKPASYFNFCVE
jgi:D-alanyl-D-alanine dipeptidase